MQMKQEEENRNCYRRGADKERILVILPIVVKLIFKRVRAESVLSESVRNSAHVCGKTKRCPTLGTTYTDRPLYALIWFYNCGVL